MQAFLNPARAGRMPPARASWPASRWAWRKPRRPGVPTSSRRWRSRPDRRRLHGL